jgi:co-chaperonin GroES (HSP10)|tara:strand:+ start:1405 stop:1752 length:348 start_codon:yes stop_codon:yes gene_type:complete
MEKELPIQPVYNRIIVKRENDDKGLKYDGREVEIRNGQVFSKFGLFMPGVSLEDVKRSQISKGCILAVGDTCDDQFMKGQNIVWGKYAGTTQEFEGEKYEIINDEDVLFIVKGGK